MLGDDMSQKTFKISISIARLLSENLISILGKAIKEMRETKPIVKHTKLTERGSKKTEAIDGVELKDINLLKKVAKQYGIKFAIEKNGTDKIDVWIKSRDREAVEKMLEKVLELKLQDKPKGILEKLSDCVKRSKEQERNLSPEKDLQR